MFTSLAPEPHDARRRRAPRVLGLVGIALASLLVPTTTVYGGGSSVRVVSNVSKSNNSVGIAIRVVSGQNVACSGTAVKGKRRIDQLPPMRTGSSGAGQWSWVIAPGVSKGRWAIRVACTHNGRVRRHTHRFLADAGYGRGSGRRLYAPGTLRVASVRAKPSRDGGRGQASGAVLYPTGQCTWFVALQRPDLPYFPGRSGDAKNWLSSAQKHGFQTGLEPRVGAVAVFEPGQYGAGKYGHVAYVTGVEGSIITLSEANFGDGGISHTRRISSEGVRFIYWRTPLPPPLPAPAPSSPAGPSGGTPPGKTITVFNVVTSGSVGRRERDRPARLSTKPRADCTAETCDIVGSGRSTGETYDVAVCWTTGQLTDNGNPTTVLDDENPNLYSSEHYYKVRLATGTTGYISWVWIQPDQRGGLGLPGC